jgi:DNA-binding transcriptional LysR family regulator
MEGVGRMDLRQLQTFETVASLLNFTRAAQVLGYAQSSVTNQIKALEDEVGQPLFEWLGKRVALTEAGRRFRPYAARILALAHEALQAAQESDLRGVLRIGAPESLCGFRLPSILRQYRTRFPGVQLLLETGVCYRVCNALRTGEIDIGIVLDEYRNEPDLIVRPVAPEPIALVAYPWHRLATAERVLPADLAGEPIIQTEAECTYRQLFERIMAEAGVIPQVAMEFTSIEPIKQCVMAGLGITVLPRVVCAAEFEQGSLVELNWAGPPIAVVTQLMIHKDKRLSPALTAFIDLFQHALAP